MPPIIDPEKCIQCGACVDTCTEDVYYKSREGEVPLVTYPEECAHCNCCIRACPVPKAIRLRIPLSMMLVYK